MDLSFSDDKKSGLRFGTFSGSIRKAFWSSFDINQNNEAYF